VPAARLRIASTLLADEILLVISGAKGDRTPDLRIANAALSQLSYCPEGAGGLYAAPIESQADSEAWSGGTSFEVRPP
jgi:hypothetical protein